MYDGFFKTDKLNSYIGEYLLLKSKDKQMYNYFLLDSFIQEDNHQPYTGQLFMKYKFSDICLYTFTTDYIEELYVYDVFDDKMKMLLIQIGYKNNMDCYLIHYLYKFLINGKIRLY